MDSQKKITFECAKCGYENYLATAIQNPKFYIQIIRSLEDEKNVFAQKEIASLKAKFVCSKCRCNNYGKMIDFRIFWYSPKGWDNRRKKGRCAS